MAALVAAMSLRLAMPCQLNRDGRNKSGHDEEGQHHSIAWRRATDLGLTFHPITDSDLPVLARIYASTRADELRLVPWSDAEKAAFCDMQFKAQHTYYQSTFADADWLLICRGDEAVGRLYIERQPREHHIIDIAFLTEQRRHGFGTAVMRDLLDEAVAAGKPASIHVERFNPALNLYQRLGFVKVEEQGVYDLMRWTPDSA